MKKKKKTNKQSKQNYSCVLGDDVRFFRWIRRARPACKFGVNNVYCNKYKFFPFGGVECARA